jgi:tetratricopeptide (TPR) repeat protein
MQIPKAFRARDAAEAAQMKRAEMTAMLARAALEQALVDAEATSPESPEVAVALSALGRFLFATGDVEHAGRMFERALLLYARFLAPDHEALAAPLADLGMVRALASPAEAAPLLGRALAIDERVLDAQHPRLGERLSALGMVLYDLGEATSARPLLERALAIHEQHEVPNGTGVATALANLALIRRALGEAAEAEALLSRALSITGAID